jgi:hypothetical protein
MSEPEQSSAPWPIVDENLSLFFPGAGSGLRHARTAGLSPMNASNVADPPGLSDCAGLS